MNREELRNKYIRETCDKNDKALRCLAEFDNDDISYIEALANDIEREVDAMLNKDKTVTELIREWAIERNLHTADPHKQALKLGEEFGELFEGLAKGNEEMTKDALGDMYVVMTIMAQQLGFNIEECIEIAYGEIKHRKGRMVDGVFIKESDLDDNR